MEGEEGLNQNLKEAFLHICNKYQNFMCWPTYAGKIKCTDGAVVLIVASK